MPSFTYVGDDERTFPHVSLAVSPGDVVELDENPDARFFTDGGTPTPPAADPTPEPVPADEKDAD